MVIVFSIVNGVFQPSGSFLPHACRNLHCSVTSSYSQFSLPGPHHNRFWGVEQPIRLQTSYTSSAFLRSFRRILIVLIGSCIDLTRWSQWRQDETMAWAFHHWTNNLIKYREWSSPSPHIDVTPSGWVNLPSLQTKLQTISFTLDGEGVEGTEKWICLNKQNFRRQLAIPWSTTDQNQINEGNIFLEVWIYILVQVPETPQ